MLGIKNTLLGVQVTELNDGVFIGFSVNHVVVDGTSLWNFINMYSKICIGEGIMSQEAYFARDSMLISKAVLKIPEDVLKVTFDEHAPLSERVFRFSRESILKLKNRTNNRKKSLYGDGEINVVESIGKEMNDEKVTELLGNWLRNAVVLKEENNQTSVAEISSFQSLCSLLWRVVTRARKFPDSKMTTFRMAVNCRHRLSPKLDKHYFGNAIQSIPTYATAGDVLSHDLKWCAEQLNKNVLSYDDIVFDGKISAFPGREGGGSVDLEVVLSRETMVGIESNPEFMEYVTCDCS
nr:uncharacterized acetyltransferase At3g50280-like [Tanacetum cinerariifolium]